MRTLVWRATFIETADEEETPPRSGLPRSRSEPVLRDLAEAAELFTGERRYVAELCAKFRASADAPQPRRPLPAADDLSGLSQAWKEDKDSVARRNRAVMALLLQAKLGRWAGDARDATLECATRAPTSAGSSTAATAGGAASLVNDKADSAPELPEEACNAGSVGHPALCSRPCLYFAADECANGDSCGYCHMEHGRRSPQLNKKHRERLQQMDADSVKALLMPLVREKALALDASEEGILAVDRLCQACGATGTPSLRLSSNDRSLGIALRGMNLRILLITVERSFSEGAGDVGEAVRALLHRLRSVA